MNQRIALLIEPLEPSRFAPFGDVIEAAQARTVFSINTGTAQRFHDLAHIDTAQHGGAHRAQHFSCPAKALSFCH
jgi:ureidoglycolate lyase